MRATPLPAGPWQDRGRDAQETAGVVEEACLMGVGTAYLAAVEAAREHHAEAVAHARAMVADTAAQLGKAVSDLQASELEWHRALRVLLHWESVPTDDLRSRLDYDDDPGSGPVRFSNVTVSRPPLSHLLEPLVEQMDQMRALLDTEVDADAPRVQADGTTSLRGVRWER